MKSLLKTISGIGWGIGMGMLLWSHRINIRGWVERTRLQWWEGISLCVPAAMGVRHGCIDYNGPWGNNDPQARGWQRLVNFVGSDCYIALLHGYCWDEFIHHIPCRHNHGGKNCSELIGRSSGTGQNVDSTRNKLTMHPMKMLLRQPEGH